MSSFSVEDIALPKWPALVVVGESVSPELAAEILVRTDRWYISTNDEFWEKTIAELRNSISGIAVVEEEDFHAKWAKYDRQKEFFGAMELNYLNNSRVASCWIGGAHGWMDWSGKIGCSNYNIGKWPDAGDVLEEWQRIAETWPTLRLRSQLFAHEAGFHEGDVIPLIEFVVAEGKVTPMKPTEVLAIPECTSDITNLMMPRRERGCSGRQYREALELVKRKMGHG